MKGRLEALEQTTEKVQINFSNVFDLAGKDMKRFLQLSLKLAKL